MSSKFRRLIRLVREFFSSIRFRLTLWTLAVLAVVLLIFDVFVYTRQMRDLNVQTHTQLEMKSQQLEVLYRLAGLYDTDVDHFQAPDLVLRGSALIPDQDQLALVGPDGQTLQTAGGIEASTIDQFVQFWRRNNPPNLPMTLSASMASSGMHGPKTRFLFQITPLVADRRPVGMIILGRPVDPGEQLPRLALTLLLGSLATLAIALGGGYWLAGRAMAPVRTITRTARGITETDLQRRLKLGTRDELGELADTFDAMLDRLQAAFDRQRQFTADASHELRTPLTIVGLEADQALARRRSGEEYERALKVIKSENELMAGLVNNLLTLARMDAGQTQLKLEPLDLSDVTLEVVERLTNLANRDGVTLQLGDLPEVNLSADRQLLTQLLTNLLENAIKYAGGEDHHVRVETGLRTADGIGVGWVQVEDDGAGIPAEDIPHLFDRFYRVDKARTRIQAEGAESDDAKTVDGSGLGLSIVQWIAHAHRGQVQVRSELGKGSVFEVTLPLENNQTMINQ